MKRLGVLSVVTLVVMALFALSAVASISELYFSSDKNGQNRVTNVQEGSQVWMVVYDPDENIDCDVRDKFWTDAKVFDPKTGAYINWAFAPERAPAVRVPAYGLFQPGHYPGKDVPQDVVYFEETGADTGLFVSTEALQIGTRYVYRTDLLNTHWVGVDFASVNTPNRFHAPTASDTNNLYGQFEYIDGARVEVQRGIPAAATVPGWVTQTDRGAGRFENMDTLIGMVVDQNDETDVATAMMKIIDTEATITWDQEIYKDANGSATITVVDADENLNCNAVEYVPVFIIVNPGSWNPVGEDSANDFCMLKRFGGMNPENGNNKKGRDVPIRWYNIYDSDIGVVWPPVLNDPEHAINNDQPTSEGAYYMEYAVQADDNVTFFDTSDGEGFCRVMFYAQETGVNTGVFQLNLNSILDDLGFDSLRVRDVLVAYYLDPNDEDDFKLDAAYIEEKMHSITSFTDATRQDKEIYWIGRDPVYVQVIDANANVDPCCPEQVVVFICDPHEEDDAEWLVLDETSSNSPVFFTNSGTELDPVWDAMGVGTHPADTGGYQLQLDNWKLEVFNEDDLYVRYNDVYYVADDIVQLGDIETGTAFPPKIDRIRVANDVSFDLMSIADTQVYNGQAVSMYFLDRQGNRVNGYVNSDCVFIEVVDADQNEDILRRERIDGFWDDHQNLPFGPQALRPWLCTPVDRVINPINALLGDTNIFNTTAADSLYHGGWSNELRSHNFTYGMAKIYVLNPRSGHWAALDLLETGVSTGDFVSVICVDLVSVYTCVPTLGALPGDTVVAFYQDPSNHSDSAMIQVKVGIGGGGTPPSQASSTTFVNSTGVAVTSYTDADLVYVKVVDPSHAGATQLENAVTINGQAFSLAAAPGMEAAAFITTGLDLNLAAGATMTATYKDPTDPTDASSDTITVVASKLEITAFYAGPTPAAGDVTFGFSGTGVASVMSVAVYDLAGQLVWANDLANVTKIVWDCGSIANGAYIYLVEATDGTDTFSGKGTLFVNR
jgi:hypothetical protein